MKKQVESKIAGTEKKKTMKKRRRKGEEDRLWHNLPFSYLLITRGIFACLSHCKYDRLD